MAPNLPGILVAVLLAGATAAGGEVASAATGTPAATSSRSGITIKAVPSRYGTILFDGRGRALYAFTRDRGATSRCYGECARAWPVAYTRGTPRAGRGVSAALLGRTRRRDGSRQVTYRGRPLYYYVSDPVGQVTCQNVREYGGLWLVVRPNGKVVRGG